MRRIIFVIAVFLFSLTSVMGQKIPINLPADGNWPTIVGDSIMIIGPLQNELTEEQRYFNPVYMIVYPGKEHLQAQIIRAGLCDCDLTKPNRRIGVFSVAPDKQVSFSQGNLQYLPAINLWKFANTQYEYLGNANKYLKPTFRNWVDLFGWSANNTTAPFGVSTSTNVADYAGDFVDWGTNTICGDAPGTWRTLSVDEWGYLFKGRKNATQLYSKGNIDGLRGMIILPDNWVMPEGLHFTAQPTNLTMELDINTYTQAEWQRMEEAGAVFLCPTGRRDGTKIDYLEYYGGYWSSSKISNSNHVCHMYYNYKSKIFKTDYKEGDHSYGTNGRAVRLVHDTIVPETIPDPCLVVKVNDTLSINMMCVEGGTFTMGDGENAHPVSLSSYSIGQTEVTQALWEAVMGTNPSANTANKQLPVTNISWYDCQEFIKKLNQQTGMRFRLPTEAEWEYAARGGQRSKGYVYAGSDDLKEVAWYNGNSGNASHIVAQKKPNELGIYDMSGNVWEWCHDWHAPCPTTHQYNPLGPEVGKVVGKRYLRVFRGGSYGYEAAYLQNMFRDITGPEPNIGTANLGLRLVLSDDVNFETIHVNDTLSFHIMDVKGGTFTMGDDNTSNASPAHQVTLSDYYIGQTEVTQTLWKAVMGNIPTGNKNPSHPVGQVTYADCQDFITKLNNLTGLYFQLPTEAEWEYAAMGGNKSHGYIYSGSNTIDDVAWYDQNSENTLHNVGAKQPNELGIYDMSGNAWEWCADYYGPYSTEPQTNPQGPATGTDRVIRSGSFRTTADRCTNKHRQAREADYSDSHITLRLVLHDTEPRPEPEYVDLGLSVKWATFNVGATSPEDYGDYFAWGETEPKEEYSWATYKWCDGTQNTMTKYNATDGKTILEPEDDAAHVHWGDKWRMPTEEEQQELIDRCSWERTNLDGVIGYKVTGPNGNSIFIPIAGAYNSFDDQLNSVGSIGWIYSSTIATEIRAYEIHIEEGGIQQKDCSRCVGLTIRPVYDDRPSKRIGVFSVAKDKQVSFSQGNLQYTQSTDEWRFAENQYDYIGEENVKDGKLANRIDLFGWSANNTTAPFGVSTSTNNADYVGEFVDWGTNIIQGDAANTWRTLSKEEWEYLIKGRKNASNLRAAAQVNGVNGMILQPDDWECPEGIDFKAGYHTSKGSEYYAEYQQFTKEQWRELETTGAIFLPAAGMHDGNGIADIQAGGYYWSATDNGDTYAYTLISQSSGAYLTYDNRYDVRSVRLVHDTIVLPPAPCQTFEVNGVTFNMMCVEGGTFTMGEGRSDAHQVTLSDYYIGETEVTQALWEAVMDEPVKGKYSLLQYGDNYPMGSVTLAECQNFVERLSKHTGRHFRIPTEAEWEYAARGGKHSNGYTYAGSDSLVDVAWSKQNGGGPRLVAQLRPNELGVYDMSGNMCEWVSDWYAPYNLYPQINPTGAAVHSVPGRPCIYRGGCYSSNDAGCLTTIRHQYPIKKENAIGFRIAMSDVEPFRAVYLNDTTRFYLRPVKKGTFMMGSKEDDPIVNQNKAAKADELPQHKVTLDSDYWVAEYELTQALWTAVMGTDIYDMQAALTKPCSGPVPAGPSYPMYFVYTKDVLEFTRRLSQMTGLNFRLPTEAEWEFAARGGNLTHGYLYAGSNNVDSVAWYTGSNSGIQTVGQKMPNELGLYDLSGNVLERCIDYLEYHQSYNPNDSINPRGRLLQSGNRAYRGGAHNMHKDSVRVTHRAPQTPTFTSQNVGTRLVVNDKHHFQTFNVGSVWFDMIFVKGGTFQMGATEEQGSEAAAHEFPVHEVTLSDYYIGQIEVTQRLWQTVMGSSNNPSTIKDSNKPVNNVTWEECQVFVEKLSQMTGYYFRLPTEAEWEFAARGGNKSKGYKYSGSDNLSDVAWYTNNSSGTTHAFATKLPNELGIYDMSGNVWEWCYDWYGPYSAEAQVDPTGPETGEYHMYRGGGWTYVENDCRVARRRQIESYNKEFLGLRLAMSKDAMIPLPEPDPVPSPGRRIGVFSVAKDKQVSFSQGNLQYIQSTDTWQFAKEQYDYLGEDNVKDGVLADKIDLFGWSGEGSNAPFGVSNSTNVADYQGTFVDWGTTYISGEVPGTWRTLSKDEWVYLIEDRENAQLLYGVARVNGVNGMVLLPDADYWICPMGITFHHGLTAMDGSDYYPQHNDYTLEQWMQMEAAGAVFFPAMGIRVGTEYRSNEYAASIWTSTPMSNNTHAYLFNFHSNQINISNTAGDFYLGRSVRLVHDTIVPPPAPCQTFEVNGVTFNMMCVEGGTFTMGATEEDSNAAADERPQHEVTVSDFMISQTEVTQELWTAIMGTTLEEERAKGGGEKGVGEGDKLPMYCISWHDCQAFVAKLNQLTGLHFRLPTEAEWEFAARGGNKSRGYLYSGSDDPDKVGWHDTENGKVQVVASLQPNELGIYDMSGNVWEWCLDGYQNYQAGASVNPLIPMKNQAILRGGSTASKWGANSIRVTKRLVMPPTNKQTRCGLRLVLDTHQYVDLGLSVMWATCNVGAEEPEGYGDYYAWGETEPKEEYSMATYKHYDKSTGKYIKYNSDSLTMLEPEDDAAHVNWGGKWRMPTKEEMNELIANCTWTWTQNNGIGGYEVTGPNGNSIFLPAAGYKGPGGPSYPAGEYGLYWLKNELNVTKIYFSDLFFFNVNNRINVANDGGRRFGFSVRPVLPADREILTPAIPGKRIGVFSVAKDKQVSFSQGNLQYVQSTDTWQFAANQLEYMGHKHYRNGQLADTIEYFGWSGKNSKAPWGISLSTESSDYAGEFLDWGINTIAGSAPNTWRTLSNDEWLYICQGRKNADQLLGLGTISTVTGLIILPDDWQLPAGLSFTPNTDNATKNQYTYNQWAVMENAGAVFIATSGYFNPKLGGMRHVGGEGHIRTNALSDNGLQVYSVIKTNKIIYSYSGTQEQNLQYAFAQRLVHDTIVPKSKIIWYTDEAIKEGSNGASGTFMAGWAYLHPEGMETTELNRRYQGKRINCIRLQVAQAGTFTVSVANRDRLDSIFNIQTIMLKDPSKEPQVYHLPQTIHLQKNQVLVFANPTDQARFYYSSNVGDISFADYVGHPDQTVRITEGPKTLNIDAGYYCEDGENCDTLAIPEPEYVDLGLSVKWATLNVGATSPEDYGDYFAWGER